MLFLNKIISILLYIMLVSELECNSIKKQKIEQISVDNFHKIFSEFYDLNKRILTDEIEPNDCYHITTHHAKCKKCNQNINIIEYNYENCKFTSMHLHHYFEHDVEPHKNIKTIIENKCTPIFH